MRAPHREHNGPADGAEGAIEPREPSRERGLDRPAPARAYQAPVPADTSIRVLGSKLDGGTRLRLRGAPPIELRKSLPFNGQVEREGVLFDVMRRGPYSVALVHREAAIYLNRESVHLEADKRGLRGAGERAWFIKWLDIATRIVRGAGCASIQDAEAAGWRVVVAEIALDVVGLPVPLDVENFSTVTDDCHAALRVGPDGRPSWLCPTGTARPRDGLGVTIQDKGQWARSKKGGQQADLLDHPDEGPLLAEQGLRRGERSVTRIEAHLLGRALSMHEPSTGEVFYDVGSIHALLDPATRARVWAHVLATVRYVQSGDGPATSRPTRSEWEALTAMATPMPLPQSRLVRATRTARGRSTAEEELRLRRRADRTAERLAALRAERHSGHLQEEAADAPTTHP